MPVCCLSVSGARKTRTHLLALVQFLPLWTRDESRLHLAVALLDEADKEGVRRLSNKDQIPDLVEVFIHEGKVTMTLQNSDCLHMNWNDDLKKFVPVDFFHLRGMHTYMEEKIALEKVVFSEFCEDATSAPEAWLDTVKKLCTVTPIEGNSMIRLRRSLHRTCELLSKKHYQAIARILDDESAYRFAESELSKTYSSLERMVEHLVSSKKISAKGETTRKCVDRLMKGFWSTELEEADTLLHEIYPEKNFPAAAETTNEVPRICWPHISEKSPMVEAFRADRKLQVARRNLRNARCHWWSQQLTKEDVKVPKTSWRMAKAQMKKSRCVASEALARIRRTNPSAPGSHLTFILRLVSKLSSPGHITPCPHTHEPVPQHT